VTATEAPVADAFADPGEADRPQWVADENGVLRDRWERPGILLNGKRRAYTRISTVAKLLDDTWTLTKWQMRGVLLGTLADPRILQAAATLDETDRAELDELCAAAREAAGQNIRRELGTWRHALSERLDLGTLGREEFEALDDHDQSWLMTYWRLGQAAGFRHVYREVFVVNDRRGHAGTTDSLVTAEHCRMLHVVDLKSGRTADFSILNWTTQVADYAEGVLYDVETDERPVSLTICQEVGYIMHVPDPDDEAEATVFALDLKVGRAALDLAAKVRDARNWGKRRGSKRIVVTLGEVTS